MMPWKSSNLSTDGLRRIVITSGPGCGRKIIDEAGRSTWHVGCNVKLLRGETRRLLDCVLVRFGDPVAVARRLWLDEIGGVSAG